MQPLDFEYVDYAVLYSNGSHTTSFEECGPTYSRVAGFDRGNDDSGTTTDEGLAQNFKDADTDEDKAYVQFWGPDDPVGEPVHWNKTDELVVWYEDCLQNPEEAGWYQMTLKVNGTTYQGEYTTVFVTSHYIWFCECNNRQEAEEVLGPPPNEQDNNETPTEEPGDATPTPTPTEEPGDATPTPTPTEEPRDATPTPTPTSQVDTTSGESPGLGVIVTIVGLLVIAIKSARQDN